MNQRSPENRHQKNLSRNGVKGDTVVPSDKG